MEIIAENIQETYDNIIKDIKSLPPNRKHFFLFGVRAEYPIISQLQDMITKDYKMELTKGCDCSNVWNVVVTVK